MRDSKHVAELAGPLKAHLSTIRFPLSAAVRREIRIEVCEYAARLKELGIPPERVLVALKSVATEAGVKSTPSISFLPADLDSKEELLVDLVEWCIDGYYEFPRRAD